MDIHKATHILRCRFQGLVGTYAHHTLVSYRAPGQHAQRRTEMASGMPGVHGVSAPAPVVGELPTPCDAVLAASKSVPAWGLGESQWLQVGLS